MSDTATPVADRISGNGHAEESAPVKGRKPKTVRRTFSESYDAASVPCTVKVSLPSGHKFSAQGDVKTNDPAELVELIREQAAKEITAKTVLEYADGTKAGRAKRFAPHVLADMVEEHFLSVLS